MIKILMPFRKCGGLSIHDNRTYGGLEMFAKFILKNITSYDIRVVEYTDDDVKSGKKMDIIMEAVADIEPDVILINYVDINTSYGLSQKVSCPIIMVLHPLGENIQFKNMFIPYRDFRENGNSIYMVSQYQKSTWERLAKNTKMPMFDVDGYISPACYAGHVAPNTTLSYDIVTVGRTDRVKDPFLLHRKFDDSGLKYAIVTGSKISSPNLAYSEKYKDVPTITDIPHTDVMNIISNSRVYLSTCPAESWGIVQLEALSCGVPVLCAVKTTSAIVDISPVQWGFEQIKSGASKEEYLAAFHRLSSLSHQERLELARLTQEKHSIGTWLASFTSMVENTIAKYRKCDAINIFFV